MCSREETTPARGRFQYCHSTVYTHHIHRSHGTRPCWISISKDVGSDIFIFSKFLRKFGCFARPEIHWPGGQCTYKEPVLSMSSLFLFQGFRACLTANSFHWSLSLTTPSSVRSYLITPFKVPNLLYFLAPVWYCLLVCFWYVSLTIM